AVTQDQFDADASANAVATAIPVDPTLASRYGASGDYTLYAEMVQTLPGNYYTSAYGRGCANASSSNGFGAGNGCDYNGPRWFNGPSPAQNETKADPNAGNKPNAAGPPPVKNFNNAGELAGVTTIHHDLAYQTINNVWRVVHGALGGAARAADYNVYWGAGGLIDSVIDVSHNVVVPFAPTVGASWGILNQAASGSTTLTSLDMCKVEPLHSFFSIADPTDGLIGCGADPVAALSNTAVPGPLAFVTTGFATVPAASPGFIIYLPGYFFNIELAGGTLPAQGTVWSMRSYSGAVTGGHGDAGDEGSYAFFPAERPFTAVGVTNRLTFSLNNQVVASTADDLSRVHTVPDPYYVTSQFEQTTDTKIIKFVNLPADCIIRIYSSSGVLVDLLEHHSETLGGAEDWNVRNRNNQIVASGVYFYHIEAGDARRVGRFTVVNFAQ
ncbi:MAG: hypothetical protein ACJ8A6_11740, partial [Gemmatimonadales bacterium]